MNDWTKQKTSLVLVIVSVILAAFFVYTASAQEKNVKPSAKIEFSEGQTKIFSPPMKIKGTFKTENFTISYLPIEKIESIEFVQDQKHENNFLIKHRDAEKIIRGSFSRDASLTGSGEWGKETVAMSAIKSIQLINTDTGNTTAFKPKSRWQCIFKNGDQLVVGWTSTWSRDTEFKGNIGDGTLRLDGGNIANITQNDNLWTVISNDGFSLEGWQPPKSSFSAYSPFGKIELSWSKVAKLSNERDSSEDLDKKPKKPHSNDWRIEIGGRFVLPVSEVQTGTKAMINSELMVESLNWDYIDTTVPTSTGLQLNFSNEKSWILQGTISGNSPVGKVEAPIRHITKLERLKPFPKNRVPSDYNKRIIATITAKSGTEYPAGDPLLKGGSKVVTNSNFFGYDLLRVLTPPVEMWVSSKSVLSHTLSTVEGKLVSQQYGPLGGFAGIKFTNPAGQFNLPWTKLSQYSPQASPVRSGTSTKQAAKYHIIVKDEKGNEFTGDVSSMEFARYPSRGWVGSYSKWNYPFQWQRSKVLYFKNKSGTKIDVEFDKLKMIHISGYYGSNRPAVLTSKQGSQMTGQIYPGDVAKSHGVSSWDPNKEGLLCKLTNGMYVYVPFSKGITVDINSGRPK